MKKIIEENFINNLLENKEGWIPISSACISWIKYYEEDGLMFVIFNNSNKSYIFCNIDTSLYKEFLNSKSKGLFFNLKIKNNPKHDFRIHYLIKKTNKIK